MLTSHCSCGATSTEVVDHDGVTFHHPIVAQVAAEPGVSNLTIFKHADGDLDSVYGGTTALHELHCHRARTVCSQYFASCSLRWLHVLVASLQVMYLVLFAVVTGSSVYEYACNISLLPSMPRSLGREHGGCPLLDAGRCRCYRVWAGCTRVVSPVPDSSRRSIEAGRR